MNKIVLKFLYMYEKMPAGFWEEHLDYEIKSYKAQGLRPEYKEEPTYFSTVPQRHLTNTEAQDEVHRSI